MEKKSGFKGIWKKLTASREVSLLLVLILLCFVVQLMNSSFLTPKTICPRGSAYSAATVLPDGTVGIYYEEEGLYGCYTMRFVRFSLNWASNGQFSFTKKSPFRPVP